MLTTDRKGPFAQANEFLDTINYACETTRNVIATGKEVGKAYDQFVEYV